MLPLMILLYNGWIFFGQWEEHQVRVQNLENQLQALNAKKTRAENDIKKITDFKANLEKSRERVQEVNRQIIKVQKQLPTETNETVVLEYLDKEAKELNLQSPTIKPAGEVLNGFYFTNQFSFNSQGTYLQFMIFFERLMLAERLYNVKKLTLRSDGVEQKGRFTLIQGDLILETYKYNSSHQEKSGVEEIEAKYKL